MKQRKREEKGTAQKLGRQLLGGGIRRPVLKVRRGRRVIDGVRVHCCAINVGNEADDGQLRGKGRMSAIVPMARFFDEPQLADYL